MDNLNINGTFIWYYYICKREVWYISRGIVSNQSDDNIVIGSNIHESSYKRGSKEVSIDGSKIDRINVKGKNVVVSEIKKSSKFEEASTMQLLLYLQNLKKRGIEAEGILKYPTEKKNVKVILNRQREDELTKGAMTNILGLIKTYANKGMEVDKAYNSIVILSNSIDSVRSIQELMGLEGNARDAYYKTFDMITRNSSFIFDKRSKQPPRNNINTLISFGNTLLYTTILSEIYRTHLDPRIGYLHSTNFRKFSLNLDVSEVFKPIIIDRTIFSLINKRMLSDKHFNKDLNGILLKENGKKIFLEAYDKRLNTTIQHKGLKRKVSYRQLIRLELYKLQKLLLEGVEYKPYKHNF